MWQGHAIGVLVLSRYNDRLNIYSDTLTRQAFPLYNRKYLRRMVMLIRRLIPFASDHIPTTFDPAVFTCSERHSQSLRFPQYSAAALPTALELQADHRRPFETLRT